MKRTKLPRAYLSGLIESVDPICCRLIATRRRPPPSICRSRCISSFNLRRGLGGPSLESPSGAAGGPGWHSRASERGPQAPPAVHLRRTGSISGRPGRPAPASNAPLLARLVRFVECGAPPPPPCCKIRGVDGMDSRWGFALPPGAAR